MLAALIAVAPAGCATEEGGTIGDVSRAAESAASAAASGELAMGLYRAHRSTRTATDTALSASIDLAQEAEIALATRVVTDSRAAETRGEVLQEVREATDALTAARAWLTSGSGDGAAIQAELDDAATALSATADELAP